MWTREVQDSMTPAYQGRPDGRRDCYTSAPSECDMFQFQPKRLLVSLVLTSETHKDPASITQPSVQTEHGLDHRICPPTNRSGLCPRYNNISLLFLPVSSNLLKPDSPRPLDNCCKQLYPTPIHPELPVSCPPRTLPAEYSTAQPVMCCSYTEMVPASGRLLRDTE